jgi:hypothetical protein
VRETEDEAALERRGPPRARKPAMIMHRIWITGGEFEFGAPVAAAAVA